MKHTLTNLFTFLGLGILLSSGACNEESNNSCQEQPWDPEIMCTMHVDPVCGCNNVTYSNACHANAQGIGEFTPGACEQNVENNEVHTVKFGFFGTRMGAEYYLLTQDALLKSTTQDYEESNYTIPMSQEQFNSALGLKSYIQELEMAQMADQTFGIPGHYDQGGFYLSFMDASGSAHTFFIDTNKDAIPANMHSLVDFLGTLLSELE